VQDITFSYILNQLINGITLGGFYALLALGYTMVYGILFMINFAHGEIYMVGAMAGWLVLAMLDQTGWASQHWVMAIGLAFIAAMAASSVLGVLVERISYRPLRNAPRLAPLISAIGTSIFLQNAMLIILKGEPKNYPDIFPSGKLMVGQVGVEYIDLFIVIISILLMVCLYLFIQKTRWGKAMRAVAEDKETAALMGINVNRIIVMTFFIGSALAGAAGVLWGLSHSMVRHDMGFMPGIKAFTAAVLGGIGNIPGAVIGGFFLGIAEDLSVVFLPGEYKNVVAFSLLVLVLILRPTGIFGAKDNPKV
jgi:branched-chain amino acid transport system permease protein